MYRCRLRKNDPFIIVIPFCISLFLILFTALALLKAEKNYIIGFSLFSLIVIFAFLPIEFYNSRFYRIDEFGIHEHSYLHKDKNIPWAEIHDVCLCCLFDKNERIPVIRFNANPDLNSESEMENSSEHGMPKYLRLSYLQPCMC